MHVSSFSRGQAEAPAGSGAASAAAASEPSDREAALALRRSLTPPALPRLPGASLAARYQPGRGKVGGDWYDVITLPTGEYCLVMGDVVGSGLKAAVVMGRMRSTLRAYALETSDPADILGRLDRNMQHFEPGAMATVACVVLDPSMSRARIALAGHLPPVLACPGSRPRLAGLPGDLLIGAAAGASRRVATVAIPPGGVLCLYTDGLVERRGRTLDEGLARLAAAVTAAPPEQLCTTIMAELTGEEQVADDLSLLVLCRHDGQAARCTARQAGHLGTTARGPAERPEIRVLSIRHTMPPGEDVRVLVDAVWPRGIARQETRVDDWVPVLAPSAGLRRWRNEKAPDPGQFRRCYLAELREPSRARALARLRRAAGRTTVSLLTAEPDTEHSAAAILAEQLRVGGS